MAIELPVPLDHWVAANSRPIKIESPDDLRALGARRDFSTMAVEDAFALLHHTCQACFAALEFSVKESNGPLAYSATLTVTGPDDVGIEFPDSGKHPTAIMAKMHAAYQAVQQGAIAFMLQGRDSASNALQTAPDRLEPGGLPPRGNTTNLAPLDPPTVPKKPQPPKTIPVHMGSTSGTSPAIPDKPPATSSKPLAASSGKSPVSIVNELLQKVYSAKKLHKLANTGLKWEQKRYDEGYLARMTVTLPSGKSKSYGSVPETLSANHLKSKYPLKVETMANVAKRAVATYAIKLGVLDFIATEDVSGRALASVKLPPRPAFLPPKPPVASGSNQIELGIPSVQPETNAPLGPANDQRSSMSLSPVNDTPTTTNIQTINDAPPPNDTQTTSDIQTVNEVQAVDEIFGSPQVSRPPSPKAGNETFNADVESRHAVHERLGSYEPFDQDDQSESMDLDTDAGAVTRGNSVISNVGRKVSPDMEEDRSAEEPPKKRQKTEPLDSATGEKGPDIREVKVMQGASYVDILSAYCAENGHPQPQVTYQRQRDELDPNAPVLYHVSLVIGVKRYELSKHYGSVQSAEEKLAKRILKLFGVRPKKA